MNTLTRTIEVIHTQANGTENRSRIGNVTRVTVRLANRVNPYTVKVDYLSEQDRPSSVTFEGDVTIIV